MDQFIQKVLLAIYVDCGINVLNNLEKLGKSFKKLHIFRDFKTQRVIIEIIFKL